MELPCVAGAESAGAATDLLACKYHLLHERDEVAAPALQLPHDMYTPTAGRRMVMAPPPGMLDADKTDALHASTEEALQGVCAAAGTATSMLVSGTGTGVVTVVTTDVHEQPTQVAPAADLRSSMQITDVNGDAVSGQADSPHGINVDKAACEEASDALPLPTAAIAGIGTDLEEPPASLHITMAAAQPVDPAFVHLMAAPLRVRTPARQQRAPFQSPPAACASTPVDVGAVAELAGTPQAVPNASSSPLQTTPPAQPPLAALVARLNEAQLLTDDDVTLEVAEVACAVITPPGEPARVTGIKRVHVELDDSTAVGELGDAMAEPTAKKLTGTGAVPAAQDQEGATAGVGAPLLARTPAADEEQLMGRSNGANDDTHTVRRWAPFKAPRRSDPVIMAPMRKLVLSPAEHDSGTNGQGRGAEQPGHEDCEAACNGMGAAGPTSPTQHADGSPCGPPGTFGPLSSSVRVRRAFKCVRPAAPHVPEVMAPRPQQPHSSAAAPSACRMPSAREHEESLGGDEGGLA
jgi:hypothetical protein